MMSILKNKNRKVQTNFLKKEDLIFNIESNLNLNDAAFYFPLLFFVRSIFFDPKKMCVSHSLFSPPVSSSRWSTQLVLKQKNPDRTLLINEEQKDNGPQPFFPHF